jgi:uncharacterized repeat protein (TIGR02543 family)
LEEVIFGSSVEKVDVRAFYSCSNLKSVVLSDSVKELADYAFYKCESVETIKLNKGLEKIGNYVFTNCRNVTSLYIPDSVNSIGKHAFRGMKALQSVTVSDSVETIVNYAFYGCSVATIYMESNAPQEGWEARWNASYRPVAFGVKLSEEGYVVSFTKSADTLKNVNEKSFMQAPAREGYIFAGWSTQANATTAEFQANEVGNVADGTVLYAVWQKEVSAE